MIEYLLPAIITLGGMGIISAIILYFIAKKFEVREDPRSEEILSILPGVNCGGCGYPGCSGFANACVKASALDKLVCPVGGAETMNRIAAILGQNAVAHEPTIAVVHCNGSCDKRTHTNTYDGVGHCAMASALYGGETACSYGCLGFGDCVSVCQFNAIRMNPETRLPEVDDNQCTACGICVKTCPKLLIQIQRKGPDSHRIYIACMNKDKGGVARKACAVACTGCSKCQKNCEFEAVTMADNLARIDDTKCTLCGKCVGDCPTSAIVEHLKTKTAV